MEKINGLIVTAALIFLFTAGCGSRADIVFVEGKEVTGSSAMVVSAHPQASRIGAEILAMGGNAVDAAIATEFALAVCYPAAGNIGGGGFMLIRFNDGNYDALDYREKAPYGAFRDLYLDEDGEVVRGLSTTTHLSSGVPGTVDGMINAHKKYGTLPFSDLIQPAIDLASNGFIVERGQAASLNSAARAFNARNSNPVPFVKQGGWSEGDTLRQPDLARTLIRIRDKGREGFYGGKTADLIVEEMSRGNGIITHDDLALYRSVWREPVSGIYRERYRVTSMSPPSSGGVALLQLLKKSEDAGLYGMEFLSVEAIHMMVEAERRVYADRAKYLGDPDFTDVPVEGLLNRDYLRERMESFDPQRATPSDMVSHGFPPGIESEETTHYSIVDNYGNAVAATTTLNGGYGSNIVVDRAGFILNNEMDDFAIKPGHPNMFGLIGGEANAIEPGKRMLSSMTPVIVERDGELYLVAGTPGGSTIITTVYQIVVNMTDFGLTLGEAVAAPRFHHQWLPDQISYERGNPLPSDAVERLGQKGHSFSGRGSIGRVDAIVVSADGEIKGVADPRGDNRASGY